MIVDTAVDDRGGFGSEALFDAVNDALRHAHDVGRLTRDELESMVYPTWFRSLAELRAPFDPVFRSPSGATLVLSELTPTTLDDPFRAGFERDRDADRYAASQVGFLRGFLEPSFAAALDPGRHDDARRAVLDDVWTEAGRRIAQNPERISPSYRLVVGRLGRPAPDPHV